jgi:NIPSNAP
MRFMFHELREYDLELPEVAAFLQHFEELAIPVLTACGFDMVGAWIQDIGPNTATTFVWLARWDSLDDRSAALQKTRESADYRVFGEAVRGKVRKIDTRILRNVPFSPLLAAAPR